MKRKLDECLYLIVIIVAAFVNKTYSKLRLEERRGAVIKHLLTECFNHFLLFSRYVNHY